jgi:hypothetical protein
MEIYINTFKYPHKLLCISNENIDLDTIDGYHMTFADKEVDLTLKFRVNNNVLQGCSLHNQGMSYQKFEVDLGISESLICEIPYICKQNIIKNRAYSDEYMKIYIESCRVELPTNTNLYDYFCYIADKFNKLKNVIMNMDISNIEIKDYEPGTKLDMEMYSDKVIFRLAPNYIYLIIYDNHSYINDHSHQQSLLTFMSKTITHNLNLSNESLRNLMQMELYDSKGIKVYHSDVNSDINAEIRYIYNYMKSANEYITERLRNAISVEFKSAR